MKIPPTERPVGLNGSQCDYGGIGLQIDPFARCRPIECERHRRRTGFRSRDVGDTAYFHNVQNALAEMFVWSGSRHFAIQIEVPVGSTAEQLKPNTIQAGQPDHSEIEVRVISQRADCL